MKSDCLVDVLDARLSEVREATASDPISESLKKLILEGWPQNKSEIPVNTTPYSDVRDEMSYQDGIVPLIGHCIATWYAVFRYLVKLTELETSWGVAIQ